MLNQELIIICMNSKKQAETQQFVRERIVIFLKIIVKTVFPRAYIIDKKMLETITENQNSPYSTQASHNPSR